MPNILFISTLSLGTNPRLVKEIELALSSGFDAIVICFVFGESDHSKQQSLQNNYGKERLQIFAIPAGRERLIPWLSSVLSEKIYRNVAKVVPLSGNSLSQAVSRRSNLLLEHLKSIPKADLVIGHNPGAMWATLVAARKNNCPSGFDVEDYHPGEGQNTHLKKMTRRLMVEILPSMNYVSFASSHIKNAVLQDVSMPVHKLITVLNYFPRSEFAEPAPVNGKLKLVWFSQHIAADRGLEAVLPVVKKRCTTLELHLYGKCDSGFFKNYLSGIENIIIHSPVTQQQLHRELSLYDIGLALDIPVDENRDLVITNKLLAYLQAGLYIVASHSTAQLQFLKDFPDHATCLRQGQVDFASTIDRLNQSIEDLRQNRSERFQMIRAHSWEKASSELLDTWKKTIFKEGGKYEIFT